MLLKRLFATTTGAIVSKGAAIITALLLFRQLPAADMGRYTAVLTLVGFCTILGNAGLNPLTTREIARRDETAGAWWMRLAPLRLLLAFSAYALLVGIALFVPALVDTRLALIAGLLLVPDALAAALAATLAGLGRAALASWLDALSNLVGLAATLALLLFWHAGVLTLAWLAVVLATLYVWTGWSLLVKEHLLASIHQIRLWRLMASAATTPNYGRIICLFPQTHLGSRTPTPAPAVSKDTKASREEAAHQAFGQRFRRHLSAWKQALAAALPLGLGALAATLYFRVDTLFLSAARGGQAVAYYSAPYQIVESFWLISTSWNAIALPALARHYSPHFVERSITLLLSIGLPASLLIAFRAEDIARLVFGPIYLTSARPLRPLLWAVPIAFSCVPLVTSRFVHDRQRHVLAVLLANLALALVLDALLIPPYGVLGASIATLIVEAGALFGYLLLAQRANLGVVWVRGLLRPALLCVPLVMVLVVGQCLPFMFVLPAVILLWAALFGLLRPWEGWRLNLHPTDQSGQAFNIPHLRRW